LKIKIEDEEDGLKMNEEEDRVTFFYVAPFVFRCIQNRDEMELEV
jgi:hypothetical protein